LNICIQVQDNTGEANFVLIGQKAEKLVGNTANELLAQQTKKTELPAKFDELRKKKNTFHSNVGQKQIQSGISKLLST
jgi:hypothetical protein